MDEIIEKPDLSLRLSFPTAFSILSVFEIIKKPSLGRCSSKLASLKSAVAACLYPVLPLLSRLTLTVAPFCSSSTPPHFPLPSSLPPLPPSRGPRLKLLESLFKQD